MAKAMVKSYQQRLESLLLQHSTVFTGLEDQIERLTTKLQEIGDIFEDRFGAVLENKLKDLVYELDDHVDEFIIQMDEDQKNGSSGYEIMDHFKYHVQKIEDCFAKILQQLTVIRSSYTEGEHMAMAAALGEDEHNEERGEDNNTADMTVNVKEVEEVEGNKEQFHVVKESQASTDSSSESFANLPYYLKSCLTYCCMFPENYVLAKSRLIRLLVAEGLVQKQGSQLLEDTADENINELLRQGMLQVNCDKPDTGTKLLVTPSCLELIQKNLVAATIESQSTSAHTARCVICSDIRKIVENLQNLRPRSLFVLGNQQTSEENWLSFTGARFLRVIDLENTNIKNLPDEVADMIHLTYLSLKKTGIETLPSRLGKLQALQTLDIRWTPIRFLSAEILKLVRLRHLKMFRNMNVSGMKLPEGISRISNLLTLTGIYAGDGMAEELRKLTQLRQLGIMDVTEENANEIYASISQMEGLLCLSLEAKHIYPSRNLIIVESFCPPPLLRKLRLEGALERIPQWLGSLSSLTKLRLGFTRLSDNPTLVLQCLPNLKTLIMWQAYKGKQYARDFCKAGGFPKLEVLIISSNVLEEWTELEEGALPSLNYLHFHNCLRLKMLPEGLQFVTTLKRLLLLPLLDEHAERLKPDGGEENYKIRHIPTITFMPMSVLNSMSTTPMPPSPSTNTCQD